MPEQFKYLSIKNWDKRQPGRKGKSEWIKDYTDKDTHEDYEKLTFFQRYVLDGCRRVRGGRGKNVPNNALHIARSLHAKATDRPHIAHAIDTLIAHGLLILTNQEVDSLDIDKEIDKKREDIKPKPENPKPPPQKPQTIRPETSSGLKAVMLLPLNSGGEFAITEKDFELWKKTYPAVNVLQELQKMAAWLDCNPTRKKTRGGVKRFVNSWLSRAQDSPKGAAQFVHLAPIGPVSNAAADEELARQLGRKPQ